MSAQEWIDVAGILMGGGGVGALVRKLERIVGTFREMTGQLRQLTEAHRALVRSHRRLVDKVNDHEARLIQNGLLSQSGNCPLRPAGRVYVADCSAISGQTYGEVRSGDCRGVRAAPAGKG